MVAIYELGVKEVMVVAHSDCGACHMNSNEMIEHMKARGIKQETIDMIRFCGVDFGAWLDGFEDTEKSVKGTVRAIMEHPLIPEDIMVRGFIIDSVTGETDKSINVSFLYNHVHVTLCIIRKRGISARCSMYLSFMEVCIYFMSFY